MLAVDQVAYRFLLRPLLFTLPPEVAQSAAHFALRRRLAWRVLAPAMRVKDDRLKVDLAGLGLHNPVGLAAGFDKNCQLVGSLAALGFGYLVVGTVTEQPQPGNPMPRMFRIAKERSLINALGFPNNGLESAARLLERARGGLSGTPVAASVSGTTPDEIVRCHRRLEPLVDAIELNISSPNTEGLRVFQQAPALDGLIGLVNETRTKPLMVKLPPYPSASPDGGRDAEARERLLALARVCVERGVDALTLANSRPTTDVRLSTGAGGLSGGAIFSQMIRMVADVRGEVGDGLAINACGGISTGEDAWQALKAGATTVQLFTGLVYRGPGVVRQINRELLAIMERERVDSLNALRQTASP